MSTLLPGESKIPTIHGPLTEAEQLAIDQARNDEAEKTAEAAYKQKQTDLAESTNRLAATNTRLTWALAVFTAVSAGAGIYQGYVANKAVRIARQANDQTIQIAKDSSADSSNQFQAQLHHFDDGLGRTGLLAIHAGEQAVAASNAARAAISSADTARDALHVSERAYLVFGEVQPDYANKIITIQFLNVGHIPSGSVEVIAHEATFNLASPGEAPGFQLANEKGWQRTLVRQISSTVPLRLAIPIPLANLDKISDGTQHIFIAGFAIYFDGFKGTPRQQVPFCIHTVYHTVAKRDFITFCDPANIVPKMEDEDGYPNSESSH